MTSGSSKGTQKKYYDNGYWYKENLTGSEGFAEELASEILKCSSLSNFVEYKQCKVNNRSGCRSKNFLQPDEMFLSFERIHLMQKGVHFTDAIHGINSVEDRIFYAVDFVKDCTGFDVSQYLGNILMFDAFTLNQDRHFNNLGVIINQRSGNVRECPIFDNGDCFCCNFSKFPPLDTIDECMEKCVSMPFSANAYKQASVLPSSLKFNYNALEKRISNMPSSRTIEIVKHQIEIYYNIIPDFSNEQAEPHIK